MTVKKTKSRVQVKCPKCDEVFLPSTKEKQSRAGKAARRKGANFENKKAKQLTKWWNNNEYDYEFKRTPMSGGSALKEGFDMAGDICTNAPDFCFSLELKNAPSSFTGLHNFFSAKSPLWRWWVQAREDCPDHRIPILIFNRYDMPTFCMADGSDRTKFGRYISEIVQLNVKLDHFIYANTFSIWKFDDMLASDPKEWR